MRVSRQTRRDARKLIRLCLVDEGLNLSRVQHIGAMIAASTSRARASLLWEFHRLARLELDRRSAEVASAAPLQEELRESIRADLEQVYGRDLRMRYVERPELIGGVRVLVGSDLYDDSIQSRLMQLEKRFSSASGW